RGIQTLILCRTHRYWIRWNWAGGELRGRWVGDLLRELRVNSSAGPLACRQPTTCPTSKRVMERSASISVQGARCPARRARVQASCRPKKAEPKLATHCGILNFIHLSRPATRDPRPATRDPRPATRDPRPATRDPRPATRDPPVSRFHDDRESLPVMIGT